MIVIGIGGMIIEENNKGYICLRTGENTVLPVPLIEIYLEPGIYEAKLEDGTSIKITNPLFCKQSPLNSNYYYSLIGYVKDEKITIFDTEFDSSSNNYSIGGKVYKYKKIEVSQILTKANFPCENLNFEKIYRNLVSQQGYRFIVGIQENDGLLYLGYEYCNKDFWYGGPAKYIIKEDFIAELEDGTTIDYTGKQVIFSQPIDGESFSVDSNEIEPLGYIDGNKIILFDVSVSQRDENGVANKFYLLEVMEDGELLLD